MITGSYKYGIDVSIPGMLFASIERSPVHQGTIKRVDDTEVRKLAGVVDVIKIETTCQTCVGRSCRGWDFYYDYTVEEGVAVIATSTWAAMNARKKTPNCLGRGEEWQSRFKTHSKNESQVLLSQL
jgi:isoquinoline 1-oxidoreductase beta subunit